MRLVELFPDAFYVTFLQKNWGARNKSLACFDTISPGERIYCAVNISDADVTVRVEEAEGDDLLTGEVRNLNDIYLPPFAVRIFKKRG